MDNTRAEGAGKSRPSHCNLDVWVGRQGHADEQCGLSFLSSHPSHPFNGAHMKTTGIFISSEACVWGELIKSILGSFRTQERCKPQPLHFVRTGIAVEQTSSGLGICFDVTLGMCGAARLWLSNKIDRGLKTSLVGLLWRFHSRSAGSLPILSSWSEKHILTIDRHPVERSVLRRHRIYRKREMLPEHALAVPKRQGLGAWNGLIEPTSPAR
ncbi:hypothetical protein DFH08DRAFT_876968 [Mycena albidolilacea]|uniref:Uncharacterized protein n=1 Tax=Mycena albidolilacea TaxID=1033008 RepID=A0AAD6ZTX5_9AGAR|nr:hypothetical protein DFH08DRAFT_876968 [Mycena albidolilacea]